MKALPFKSGIICQSLTDVSKADDSVFQDFSGDKNIAYGFQKFGDFVTNAGLPLDLEGEKILLDHSGIHSQQVSQFPGGDPWDVLAQKLFEDIQISGHTY